MIKEVKMGNYTRTINENTSETAFNFYTDLTATDKLKFVNNVVNTIVDGVNYNSIILDLIFDFEIIDIFTDVDISEITESPNHIEAIEDFIAETNVVEIVKANVKEGLIAELYNAVNRGIEYKTGIHRNPINDSLSNLIDIFTDKFKGVDIESLMEVAKKFNDNTGELTPERMLEAYANTDYLKNKINHDLEEKHIHEEKIKLLLNDHNKPKKAGK